MNPYDFVRIPDNARVLREKPNKHHRFADGTRNGRIYCNLKTLTPLFIPDTSRATERHDRHKIAGFMGTMGMGTRVRGLPHIPGSSLKGVIRSVAETVGRGCFLHDKGKMPPKIDRSFEPCRNNQDLCIACRIFGMLQSRNVYKGKISISDANAKTFEMMGTYTLKPLMNPQPRHRAFYNPGGRKFYFHHPYLADPLGDNLNHWTKSTQNGYNSTVNPVAPGADFKFEIDFTNLTDEEFSLLLYSLVLEPGMRHKIGLAKPLGLGSVHITIEKLILFDPLKRYSTQKSDDKVYNEDELVDFISDKTRRYKNHNNITMQDLRTIWKWDPDDHTIYQYPTQGWFDKHSRDPISVTP